MAPGCANPRSPAMRGFTLAEMLIVVALLAILAKVMVPTLAGHDDHRLDVAASEVREALRFARTEAMRRGKKALVDAESAPGRVKVLWLSNSGCSDFAGATAATDPRTKAAFDVDVSGGPFSSGVAVTPRFMASGIAWGGLVFDANGKAADVCQVTGMNSQGSPEAGSGIVLSRGDRQVTVAIDAATGRVTTP